MRRFAYLGFDLALLGLATILALILRENLVLDVVKLAELTPFLVVCLIVAIPINIALGLDRAFWRYSVMTDYVRVVIAIGCTIVIATIMTFTYNRMEGISRSVPILQALLAVCMLIGVRISARILFVRRHTSISDHKSRQNHQVGQAIPAPPKGVLVVGLTTLTVLYLRAVAEFGQDSIRIAGIVAHEDTHAGKLISQNQIFGIQEHLPSLLKQLSVHGVFVNSIVVALPFQDLPRRLQDELRDIENTSSIDIEYLPSHLGFRPSYIGQAPFDHTRPLEASQQSTIMPEFSATALMTETRATNLHSPMWRQKRMIDAVAAGILLVCLAPLFLLLVILVALTIGVPTIFWQDRPGVGGKRFKLYKFRTMGNAHDRNGDRIPDENRLNAIGRFLRASHLDELPQLWNILVGEMSFVGPRPLLHIDQAATYTARMSIRPGLTGWAQVTGGRQVSAIEKAALDVWYVNNASVKLDLEILARTVPIALFGERIDLGAIKRACYDLMHSSTSREQTSNVVTEADQATTSLLGISSQTSSVQTT
ncbi:MAG: sugar transferase [Hyphomicrobium sp.]|nr:MAG: sugar transferase [Hyphomicrobium sp.]